MTGKGKGKSCSCGALEASAFDDKSRYPANVDQLDPLGEIRRCAKDLWKKDGSPATGCVMSYWRKAESQMLSGLPITIDSTLASNNPEQTKPSEKATNAPTTDPNEPFLSILMREVLKTPLHYHEAVCLARILHTSTIDLDSSLAIGPLSTEEIAEVLSHVEVLQDQGNDFERHPAAIDSIEIWQQRLAELFQADEALTNLDRTTIARLITALEQDERVLTVVPREQTVSQCGSGDKAVLKVTK